MKAGLPAGPFHAVLNNLVLVLLGPQGGEQGGVGADNARGERCILGTKGRQFQAPLSPLELGELGVLSEDAAPRLRPHAPLRQPASSLPSGQSCSWLQRLIAGTQAPSPHWNSSPRQVPSAAGTGQGGRVRASAVLGQLSSPTSPLPVHPWLEQNQGLSLGTSKDTRPRHSQCTDGRLKLREGKAAPRVTRHSGRQSQD